LEHTQGPFLGQNPGFQVGIIHEFPNLLVIRDELDTTNTIVEILDHCRELFELRDLHELRISVAI